MVELLLVLLQARIDLPHQDGGVLNLVNHLFGNQLEHKENLDGRFGALETQVLKQGVHAILNLNYKSTRRMYLVDSKCLLTSSSSILKIWICRLRSSVCYDCRKKFSRWLNRSVHPFCTKNI